MIEIHTLPPFSGAFVDPVFGEKESSLITKILKGYLVIMRDVCGFTKRDKWGEPEVAFMKDKSVAHHVKEKWKRNICQLQKIRLCSIKWHILYHIG